ncbi:unnamed protein product [Meganyctiphanes norvegica]|uniref:Gustatory receptor n=1 Tax=Meganyctiphanes norvegica TaxID=48144 RepID=A0AAV2RKI0_MEGNR
MAEDISWNNNIDMEGENDQDMTINGKATSTIYEDISTNNNIDIEGENSHEMTENGKEHSIANNSESVKAKTFKKYFRAVILGIDCTYWCKDDSEYKIRHFKFSFCYFFWMIFMTVGYLLTFDKYDGIHEAKILPRILTPNIKYSIMVFVAGLVPTIQPYYSLKQTNINLPHIFKHMDRLPIPEKFQKTLWHQTKELFRSIFKFIFTCDYTLIPRLIGATCLVLWLGLLSYGFFAFSWHGFDNDGFYFIIFILFYSSPSVTTLMFTRALIDWLTELYTEFLEEIKEVSQTRNSEALQSFLSKYPIADLQGIFKHICKAKAKQTLTVDMFILTYSAFFCTLQLVDSFDNFPYVVPLVFIFAVLAFFVSAPDKLDKKHSDLVSFLSCNILTLKESEINSVIHNSNDLEESVEDQQSSETINCRRVLEIMREHLLLNKPELKMIWKAKVGNGFVPGLMLTLVGYSRLVIWLSDNSLPPTTTVSPDTFNITTLFG